MEDIRLIQLRKGMTFGVKETIGTLVAGGVMMLVAIYAWAKVNRSVDWLGGGAYVNTTHYCSGAGATWNGTACLTGGTLTGLPTGFNKNDYDTMLRMRGNVTSGFDLSSVVFIVIAASAIIGVIWVAFQ